MKEWKGIKVHCSASLWGSASEIDHWHVSKGWSGIGYHFVILNGMIRPEWHLPMLEGSIEVGRFLDGDRFVDKNEIGAHALGYNDSDIGICMIGENFFSAQVVSSTLKLCTDLMTRFNIPIKNVQGHYEVDSSKTCPNIDMEVFRQRLTIGNLLS